MPETVEVSKLAEAAKDPVIIISEDYTIQDANQPWARAVQSEDIDHVCGMSALEFLPDEEKGKSRERIDSVIETDEAVPTREYRFEDLDGGVRWARGSIVPTNSASGKAAACVILTDITDQKQSEQKDRRDQIEKLHNIAIEFSDCQERSRLFELMISAAEDILDFDICLVDEVNDGKLIPIAVGSNMELEDYFEETSMESDSNVGVDSIRRSESVIVDDLANSKYAPAQPEYDSVISVPLGDWGVFQAASRELSAFDAVDLQLCELLVEHVVAADQRISTQGTLKEQNEKLQSQRKKIERLHSVGVELAECQSRGEVYDLMVEAGEDILGLEYCIVDSVQDNKFVVEATSSSLPDSEYHEPSVQSDEGGIGAKAYRDNESILVKDVQEHPEASPQGSYKSAFTVPIGEYGVFQAMSDEVIAFDQTDLELVELLAGHVRASLQRFEQTDELKTQRQRLEQQRYRIEQLHNVGVELAASDSQDRVYELMIEAAEEILEFDLCIVDAVQDDLLIPKAIATEMSLDDFYEETPVDGEFHASESFRNNETKVTGDLGSSKFAPAQPRYKSVMSVPLDEWGVFQATAEEQSAFDETDRQLAELLAEHVVAAIRRLDNEQELIERQQELDLIRQVFSRLFRHNVRNELTIIDGNAEMINSQSSNSSIESASQIMMDATDRLINHTEKAREVEEVINEERAVETGSLNRIVSTAVSEYKTEYPEADIVEDVDDVRVSAIIGLEKAIGNAVENSIVHNEEGVEVTIWTETHTDTVTLIIEDNGEGIPEDELDVVNNEKETSLSHSSGIGLWLMKWVVEKSDGEILFDNTERGARVEMSFYQ